MTNPKRGELKLSLGNQTYNCKISMDTIMRIEQNCGRGILKIASGLQDADFSATDMVSILTPVIRTSGTDVKDRDVQKLIWEAGFTEGIRLVAEIIVHILGDEEGNAIAAVA